MCYFFCSSFSGKAIHLALTRWFVLLILHYGIMGWEWDGVASVEWHAVLQNTTLGFAAWRTWGKQAFQWEINGNMGPYDIDNQ
ncbi:hypothetical protein BKA60DRAFT_323387 [Fusarium oxysporum]|nr:hypothetical protein BKA60DRAFT_323387 [Fusarium oxysporum]